MIFDSIDAVERRVVWQKSDADPMFHANEQHYRDVGASALKCIVATHLLANHADPASVLDFACGAGRVTRWLRAAFPESDLHVADINPEWMEWSATQFQATGWISAHDIGTIVSPRRFDLIWCGSLVTHMPVSEAKQLMVQFHDWLEVGGIAVVTTHGQKFINNLVAGTHNYFEHDASTAAILSDLALKGYGYVAHPGQSHGISVNTLTWLVQTVREIGARIVSISEHAWDGHHDIIAFQKIS